MQIRKPRPHLSRKQLSWQAQHEKPLTPDLLNDWIVLFYEKTGRRPTSSDQTVWLRTTKGEWYVLGGESWENISISMFTGKREWEGAKSLYWHIKENVEAKILPPMPVQRGPHSTPLTEAMLDRWILLYIKYEGYAPTSNDRDVWDEDEKGVPFRLKGTSWNSFNVTMHRGQREWSGAKSLSLYIAAKTEAGVFPKTPKRPHGSMTHKRMALRARGPQGTGS